MTSPSMTKDFKNKILRAYSNITNIKANYNNMKMIIPNHNKKDIHDLIVAYSNDIKSRQVEGTEVKENDDSPVEVSININ